MPSELQQRISAFNKIRDIPYHIATGEEDDSCCLTKSFMLVEALRRLELQARIAMTTFRWDDTLLPKSILGLAHPPIEHHASVEVLVPETRKFADVDPTWDPGLKTAFDIAEWDGLSSTYIAVPWIDKYGPEKSSAVFSEITSPEGLNDYLSKYKAFVTALNSWLQELRISLKQKSPA